MPYASVAASAEVEVYAYWAFILVRMTHGSTGSDTWTVVQDKLYPAVAEAELTRFFVHTLIVERKDYGNQPAIYPRYST
jgi:hypothetical protein